MHHTWRELRERGDGVVLHFTRFTDGRIAATDGTSAIWLDEGLLQVERRCALAHEQAHMDLGHGPNPTDADEEAACRYTAQKMIDWDALVDVFRWAHNAFEAADELWVTPEVLEDRLRHLHPHERGLLKCITATRHS